MKTRTRWIFRIVWMLFALLILVCSAINIKAEQNKENPESSASVEESVSGQISGNLNKNDPVLFLGDSYLSGVDADYKSYVSENNWGKYTSDILNLTNVRYVSEVSSGFTHVGQKGNRFQQLLEKHAASNKGRQYRLIVLAAGYNDVWHDYNSIYRDAVSFFASAKKLYPNADFVLAMIGENSKQKSISSKLHETVEKAYHNAADAAGIDYLQGGENVLGENTGYFSKDGFHPNDSGYYKIARFIAKGINRYFKDSAALQIRYHRNAVSKDSSMDTKRVSAGTSFRNYYTYPGLVQTGWSVKENADTAEFKAGDRIDSVWAEENAPCVDLYAVWGIAKNVQKIVPYHNLWYYVKDGEIQENATGIAQSVANGSWYFVRNGKVDWGFTGIAQSFANSRWYFVRNGKVDWTYTGIAQSAADGRWYFVRKGELDRSYTGIARSVANNCWYFVRKGEVDWSYTGIAKSIANGRWYFVRKGKLDWGYTGIAQSVANNHWYFVRKGELDWKYTGIAQSVANSRWYFIRKGELDWKFTGIARSIANNCWYFVRRGELDWGYTGIAQSVANNRWYFVRNGKLDWGFTGVARSVADNRLYYVSKGEVNWKYSGYARFYEDHKIYRIVKGRAV